MRRRIGAAMVLVALAGIVVLGLPLAFAAARLAREAAQLRLEREATRVAARLEDELDAGRIPTGAAIRRLAPEGRRIVVVAPDGLTRRGGSGFPGPALAGVVPSVDGWRVAVEEPAGRWVREARARVIVVALLALAGLTAATAVAFALARRLGRPLDALASASARLGAGDFSVRAPRSGIAEIDAIAEALDAGAARIGALVERERRFSADASHQLRTPLTALRLQAEELLDLAADDEARAGAARVLAEADRLDDTIDHLLASARGEAAPPAVVDVGALVDAEAGGWRRLLGVDGRRVEVAAGAGCQAAVRPGALRQALDVLVDNARRHGSGTVTVTVGHQRGHVVVRITDEGDGIAPALGSRVFERGVSTDGSGIGLPLARELVEADGGRLELAALRPATFEVWLPATPH